jgi:hypothetical protein
LIAATRTPFRASTTATPRRAEQVDRRDAHAVPRFDDGDAAARRQGARIRRADDVLAALEVRADPVTAVGVVAERDDVGAGRQEPVGELPRDAGAVGCVLAVDDAAVDVELFA